jgi:hypothetical protein
MRLEDDYELFLGEDLNTDGRGLHEDTIAAFAWIFRSIVTLSTTPFQLQVLYRVEQDGEIMNGTYVRI